MIKANELRIGNYIKFHNHLEPEKIVTVNVRFFSSLAGGRSLEEIKPDEELNGYYSPIPLTPELLLKLGFEKDGYEGAVWYQKGFPVIGELCTSDREHPLGNFLFDTNTDTLKIHYLHQLQNLYYSLTGSEMEVVW